ncbi:hypothetical protein TCAL_05943 [Tigriopus californicus]|uniref:Paf1 complex subunit Cdc73 N-terminal domain-containing protein n=1 Tax=Tigriopus californicus TaxID=6832 RepID=A0A553NZJ8_TIGCA|nr:uncharacterized protein LOC131886522 [Tigriopus californicus]TRY70874.1 hypothetical protein TCAL_05943 [Tigriopus californicus]|eukprot:TCALIF_05943-PA protein Name:"Similar to CDC73 Parafibromin (Gallus gallus)" AED:0.42 eAED:0.44 QI:0/-1/0/1/-1/1/1/0/1360
MARKVVGTLFQVNKEAVLFEFMDNDEETIGVIRPGLVRLGPKGKTLSAEEAKSLDEINKYMSPGDEIVCKVASNSEGTKVTCQEDEEEIGPNGDIQVTCRLIEITPDWIAIEGYLVEVKKIEGGRKVDEIGDIDIPSGEEVTLAAMGSLPPSPPSGATGEKKDIAEEAQKKTDESKCKPTIVPTNVAVQNQPPEGKETTADIALVAGKIVQLKKPAKCFTSKAKVSSLYIVLSEGEYEGQKFLVQNNAFYIWGHCLRQADFLYNVRGGDEVVAEVHTVNGGGKVKNCYIGQIKKEPVSIVDDLEFGTWMGSRSLDYEAFMRWVDGKLMLKNFFPLASRVDEGELVEIAKVEAHTRGHGGLVKLMSGSNEGKFAFFTRRDLYIHSVNVGNADLFRFLKIGDKIKCQLEEISSSEKRKFKKFLKSSNDIHFVAYVAFIGDVRPKSATLMPHESLTLKDFLKAYDLSPSEFQKMRIEPLPEEDYKETTRWEKPEESSALLPNQIIAPNEVPSINTFQQQAMAACNPHYPFYDAINTYASQHNMIAANSLCAKALMIQNPDGPVSMDLLRTKVDYEVAYHLAKIFTTALTQQLHGDISQNSLKRLSKKKLQNDLKGQNFKLGTIGKSLESYLLDETSLMKAEDPIIIAAREQSLIQAKVDSLQSKFEEIERKNKEEIEEAKRREQTKKKEVSVSKMRNMLNQFKASKGHGPSKSLERPSKKELPALPEDNLSPLELVRLYTMEGKSIVRREGKIHFDKRSFPEEISTNYRVARTSGINTEFYSLLCIVFFIETISRGTDNYEKAGKLHKIPLVRNSDINDLEDYLLGKTATSSNIADTVSVERKPTTSENSTNEDAVEYGGMPQYDVKEIANISHKTSDPKAHSHSTKDRDRSGRNSQSSRERSRGSSRRSRERSRSKRSRSRESALDKSKKKTRESIPRTAERSGGSAEMNQGLQNEYGTQIRPFDNDTSFPGLSNQFRSTPLDKGNGLDQKSFPMSDNHPQPLNMWTEQTPRSRNPLPLNLVGHERVRSPLERQPRDVPINPWQQEQFSTTPKRENQSSGVYDPTLPTEPSPPRSPARAKFQPLSGGLTKRLPTPFELSTQPSNGRNDSDFNPREPSWKMPRQKELQDERLSRWSVGQEDQCETQPRPIGHWSDPQRDEVDLSQAMSMNPWKKSGTESKISWQETSAREGSWMSGDSGWKVTPPVKTPWDKVGGPLEMDDSSDLHPPTLRGFNTSFSFSAMNPNPSRPMFENNIRQRMDSNMGRDDEKHFQFSGTSSSEFDRFRGSSQEGRFSGGEMSGFSRNSMIKDKEFMPASDSFWNERNSNPHHLSNPSKFPTREPVSFSSTDFMANPHLRSTDGPKY